MKREQLKAHVVEILTAQELSEEPHAIDIAAEAIVRLFGFSANGMGPRKYRPTTDDMVTLRKQGKSHEEIAFEVGVCRETVRTRLAADALEKESEVRS